MLAGCLVFVYNEVGNPTFIISHNIMEKGSVREYDAKIDAKKRITLRNTPFEYYHVAELPDGKILLEPRVLVDPDLLKEGERKK